MVSEQEGTDISDEQAEEFATRMSASEDDAQGVQGARALRAKTDWEGFVTDRLEIERGKDISSKQLDALGKGRDGLLRSLERVNIEVTGFRIADRPVTRYRDSSTGRFVSSRSVASTLRGFTLRR